MAEARLYVGMGVKESMSSSASASPRDSKLSLDVVPPIKRTGLTKYKGVLAADTHQVLLTGTLPQGETTRTLAYSIIEYDTKAIAAEVKLHDASTSLTHVRMLITVKHVCDAYQVGTFGQNGDFKPVEFLSVDSNFNASLSGGPTGRIT
jgi:hypothetical protein